MHGKGKNIGGKGKKEERRKKERDGRKRGRGEEERCARKGRQYFQKCWEMLPTMQYLENFLQALKKMRRKKKREGKYKIIINPLRFQKQKTQNNTKTFFFVGTAAEGNTLDNEAVHAEPFKAHWPI